MTIVMHPLTAQGGVPSYSAYDYRHAINPLVVPSDGTAFNGLRGVRSGFNPPLVTIDGLIVTVKPHCGTVSPWENSGAYTYAITGEETVTIADSTSNYKIAVVVDDPSQSSGTTPGGRLQVFASSVDDSLIHGLVIARVSGGVVSDAAPILHQNTLVEVSDEESLDGLSVLDGQEALVSSTGKRFVREDGRWHDTVDVQSFDWLGGIITFMYGASFCTVQVSNVSIGSGSWESAVCPNKVDSKYFPAVEISAPVSVENGKSTTGLLVVGADGSVSVRNMGGAGSDGKRRGSVSWPVSKRY